jgi:hypothetical protein
VGVQRVGLKLYRVWATIASGIVTGNVNRVEVLPATTAAQLGSVYVGGVQVEGGRTPTSLIRTTGSTAARVADQITWPMQAAWRDRFTLLLDVLTPPESAYTGTVDEAGGITVLGNVRLTKVATARQWSGFPTSAMSGGTTGQAWPVSTRQRIVLQAEGYVNGGRRVRVDVGSGFGAWTAAAAGVVTAGTTVALYGETTDDSDHLVQRVLLVPGQVDKTTMETLL